MIAAGDGLGTVLGHTAGFHYGVLAATVGPAIWIQARKKWSDSWHILAIR